MLGHIRQPFSDSIWSISDSYGPIIIPLAYHQLQLASVGSFRTVSRHAAFKWDFPRSFNWDFPRAGKPGRLPNCLDHRQLNQWAVTAYFFLTWRFQTLSCPTARISEGPDDVTMNHKQLEKKHELRTTYWASVVSQRWHKYPKHQHETSTDVNVLYHGVPLVLTGRWSSSSTIGGSRGRFPAPWGAALQDGAATCHRRSLQGQERVDCFGTLPRDRNAGIRSCSMLPSYAILFFFKWENEVSYARNSELDCLWHRTLNNGATCGWNHLWNHGIVTGVTIGQVGMTWRVNLMNSWVCSAWSTGVLSLLYDL